MSVFPDVEQVAQDVSSRHAEAYKFLPDDLEKVLLSSPVALVERIGGMSDGVTDRALVQVSVWGIDRPTAWRVSGLIGEEFDTLRFGGVVGTVFVDTTERATGEVQVPTDDPDERRVTATYRIDVRKQ